MEIAKLGPAGLKRRILHTFEELPHSTLLRTEPGEDGTVLSPEEGYQVVSASAVMLEGIHFDLVYFPLRYLGMKAVTKAVARLTAMGARPVAIDFSAGLSARFEVEDVEVLMGGVKEACRLYGTSLSDCHFDSSRTGLMLSVSALGVTPEGRYLRSDTASANDLLYVTGDLGAAFLGLTLLEREKRVFDRMGNEEDFTPDFSGGEYLLRRQLQPIARIDLCPAPIGTELRPSAMTGVTEGLANDLLRLCDRSGVGCRLYEERLPIAGETKQMAVTLGLDPTAVACNGGEDYELLFALPLTDKELADGLEGVTPIGFLTDASMGCSLIRRDGSETPLCSACNPTEQPVE